MYLTYQEYANSLTNKSYRVLGPHSQYSLKKTPKCLQSFRLQNNLPKMYFQQIFFDFMSAIVIEAWH